MTPSQDMLFAALEATWPPRATRSVGGWTLRDGAGGGKRVSAATADPGGDIPPLIEAQTGQNQSPLVMVRPGEDALDAKLDAAGFAVRDATQFYAAPVADLIAEISPVRAFHVDWPALQIQRDMWAEGGIGPDRIAVMDRVKGPKIGLLGRIDDLPAGTGFAACHGEIAMVHALEVRGVHRRKGVGVNMMRAAAIWAQDAGASWLSLLVTRANEPANALYLGLGMRPVGHYHYRMRS